MKKKSMFPLVIIGLIAVIAAVSIVTLLNSKIPSNPQGTIGNTAGNIYNSGLFAENPSDGMIYFSNIYDGGCIYKMTPGGTDIEKITDGAVSNILCGGDYLYGYLNTGNGGKGLGYIRQVLGIYRYKTNGSSGICIDKNASISMQLIDDNLFYLSYNNKDYTQFYRTKTDKSESEIASDILIDPACANNGIIYFNGTTTDHYIYSYDTSNGTIKTVYKGDCWYPQYSNGYIYYMDVSSNYRLCRYNLANNNVEILTKDRLDTYNVGQRYIYYQKSSSTSPALMRIELDGSNPEVVANGLYNRINLTSEYCYFMEYNNDTEMYKTPVNGTISVSLFNEAKNAVDD